MAFNTEKQYKSHPLSRFLKDRVRKRDFYLGLFVLLFSGIMIFLLIPHSVEVQHAEGMAVSPNFFPYSISYVLAFLSLLLIYNSPRTGQHQSRLEDKRFTKATLVFMSLLFVLYFGTQWIGMVPMGILTVYSLILVFGYRRWFLALIFSIVFVVLLFFFFEKIAQVSIPRGIWFDGLY
jgi:hypothetical protein